MDIKCTYNAALYTSLSIIQFRQDIATGLKLYARGCFASAAQFHFYLLHPREFVLLQT